MIQTSDNTALIDYLVSLELVRPAMRDKLVGHPFGPVALKQGTDKGYKSMQFFIERGNQTGTHKVSGYTARVVEYPPYTHLASQHMSTAELEERMAKVDWNKESWKILNSIPNPVDTLFNDALFLRLAGNGPARDIVDILLLKYCDITPAMNMVPYHLYDKPFIKTMNVELNGHIRDLALSQAWNLLEGRAVMKFAIPGDKHSAAWYCYSGNTLDEFPNFDLPGILSAVPISGNPSYEKRVPIYLQLINGDAVPIEITQETGGAVAALLQADPVSQSIVGKDNAGNQLRFDTVDPDIYAKREALSKKHPPGIRKNKRKGRSL